MLEKKLIEIRDNTQRKLDFLKKAEIVNKKGIFHDGNTFCNPEKVNSLSDVWLIEVSSSLMIPSIYLPLFYRKVKKYKSIANYLDFLIRNYKIYIANGIIPAYCNMTTKYQDKNLDLKKVGIRAKGSDWAQLQLLRCSHGLSMSAIFVYLLKLDSVDFAETLSEKIVGAGIPNLPHLDFFGEIHLEHSKSLFSRVFRYREGVFD